MEIKPLGKNEISFPTRVHIKRGMVYEPSTGTIIPTWTLRNYDFHVDTFVPSRQSEESDNYGVHVDTFVPSKQPEEPDSSDTDCSNDNNGYSRRKSLDDKLEDAQKVLRTYKIRRA